MTMAERTLSIVVHDVAPATWAACRSLLHDIAECGPAPVTLLAVPRYHGAPRDAAFESWLQQRVAMGDEVALHGFTHRDRGTPRGWVDGLRRRHYTCGEGEFCALPRAAAARRIAAGLRWLQRLGLPASGFVAPAWLLSDGSWQAVRDQPLAYTCTLRKIHLLPRGEVIATAQSQVYSCRSAWRRVASVAWNRLLARAQSQAAHVRIELHPPDAEHPLVRQCWQQLLRRQLQVREPITLAALARHARRLRRPGMPRASEQQLHELRRREADGAADDDVARVVQAQHDA